MMRRTSPPKHRHDGTSPLPLGMDWSPPPKKWNGRDTVWPHDPRSGWSYCVTIPSWVAVPKSRSVASDPVVFYRVQVGIQSPEAITSTRGVLRRFNDFLKLFSDLKKAFPKKSLPSAPPKGLTRIKNRAHLEERRCALEEWMSKLLSDIDISRSMVVASFLELEPAVRSALREANQQSSSETDLPAAATGDVPSHQIHSSPSFSGLLGTSSSIASDYGSDTAYDTSELGSPSLGRDDSSEAGLQDTTLDEDLTNLVSMSSIDEGLLMGQNIMDQLEGFRKHKTRPTYVTDNGNASKPYFESSIGGDVVSSPSFGLQNGAESSKTVTCELEDRDDVGQITLPRDQQPKLDRVLTTMHRRLVTAKTDMEDLLTRLNQEIAVKEYLTTKVKDLEVELETTREKSKENLQQALSLEKERITKMQWDMEELRQKSLEMELKLKSKSHEECGKSPAESTSLSTFPGKDELLRELEATKQQLNALLEQHTELEVKSKSDIKVLVKEVKSLRRSQYEMKQNLDKSLQEKLELEQLLQHKTEQSEHALVARRKLLHDCQTLHSRLRDCNVKFVDKDFDADSSATMDVLDLLAESDKQIGLLLAEINELGPEDDMLSDNPETQTLDRELRLVLRDIFIDNAKLRKQMNLFIRSALQTGSTTLDEDGKQVLSKNVLIKQLLDA